MAHRKHTSPLRILPFLAALAIISSCDAAQTPKLKIKTKNGLPQEEQRKEQMERLAKRYDLKKYTVTREILIERGAMNHSHPMLTLNLRFLDNDDLALSAYVHEQAHWLLTDRYRMDNPALFEVLKRKFHILEILFPIDTVELTSNYFHMYFILSTNASM